MGDHAGDGEARERPVHVVELDAYYIAKFEMTNREWKKFRDDPGYDDPKFWPGGRVVPRDQVPYWTQANNHGGGTPDSDDYPLLGVNWDSAVAYGNWLSAKTGRKYRLPTEAEWEKAARGTDQRRFPWGNTIDRSFANFVGSQTFDTGRPVGFYDGSKRGDLQTHSNASPYGASTWRAMSWSGARIGTIAATTRSLRERIRKDLTRARIASSAAGRSSWRPSSSARPRARRHGRRFKVIGWWGSGLCREP